MDERAQNFTDKFNISVTFADLTSKVSFYNWKIKIRWWFKV